MGREREQAALADLLARHAVLAVHGPMGIGKTCLVARVLRAEHAAGRLPEPAFVSLQGAASARAVLDATAKALGRRRPATEGAAVAGELARLLETRPRAVVWDDAPELAWPLARALAGRGARFRLIVVSRRAPAEELPALEVPPLDGAAARALIAQLEAERGRTLYDELAERSAGNPLLLQLAVASGLPPPRDPASALGQTIDALPDGPPRALLGLLVAAEAPLHLRTLRAALGVPSLEAIEQLERLSLVTFDGAVLAVPARVQRLAGAALGEPSREVWAALELVAGRALQAAPHDGDALVLACRARLGVGDGTGALQLLELHVGARAAVPGDQLARLVRELAGRAPACAVEAHLVLAREQLRSGDVESAMRTLDAQAALGAGGALARNAHLLRMEALVRIGEPERAAHELSCAGGGAAPAQADDLLPIAAATLSALRGGLREARRELRQMASRARGTAHLEGERAAALAMCYILEERYERALVWARRARRCYAAADARFFESFVAVGEMVALLESDRLDQAAALAARIAREPHLGVALEPLGRDVGTLFRAGVAGRRGDFGECLALLEAAAGALDRRADQLARGVAARYLGRACVALGDVGRAERFLRIASGVATEPGLKSQVPLVEREWARLDLLRGDPDEARRRLREALARSPENPYLQVETWALDTQADAPPPKAVFASRAVGAWAALRGAERALERGEHREAEAAAQAAERWYEDAGVQYELSRALLARGEALLHLGDATRARTCLRACDAVAAPRGYVPVLASVALVEAALADRGGDLAGYVRALERAVAAAGDALRDDALSRACARAGLTAGPPGRLHPFRALVARLGLARPATHVVTVGERAWLVGADEDAGAPCDLLVDLERRAVLAGDRALKWPPMRLQLLAEIVEAGDAGTTMEALYLRIWGGREYHALRHRNSVYVALQRLRSALRPILGEHALAHVGDGRYRVGPGIVLGVRRALADDDPRVAAARRGGYERDAGRMASHGSTKQNAAGTLNR